MTAAQDPGRAAPDPATTSSPLPVSLADVVAASGRLQGVALRTPLLPFGPLDHDPAAGRVWLKPESLQPIGAFKIRGAYNALAQLDPAERAAGVVSHSSGNHAQGVARAARLLSIRAVIVMPNDAPAIKVAGVRADGAEIDVVGPANEERVARADALAVEHGLVLVPSYDDARIVAGQGTVGLEIVEQLDELAALRDPRPDTGGHRSGPAHERLRPLTVLVPVGGGGLAAGVCVAVKSLRPDATIIGAEPDLAADAAESMRQGRIVRWDPAVTARTSADGMRTSALGQIPFAILRRLLDGVRTVSEQDIAAAMLRAATAARLVVEPSGATAIAAWLRNEPELIRQDGDVVIVVSGGNVDPERYRDLLEAGAAGG